MRFWSFFLLSMIFWFPGLYLGLSQELPSVDTLKKSTSRPRLYLTKERIDLFRQAIVHDPYFKECFTKLKKEAQEKIQRPPVTYQIPDGKRLLETSREVLRRIEVWGLYWLFTNDQQISERMKQEICAVGNFPDWNPSHFLDTAEMAHAIALAYDWLYSTWKEEEKRFIRQILKKYAFDPALKAYQGQERYGWWKTCNHNWNFVCNGGLGMAALAIAEAEPELAHQILGYAIRSLPHALPTYEPDGAWTEGPAYWAYATRYFIGFLEALQNTLGTRLGLDQGPGFRQTAWYYLHSSSPNENSNWVLNFEDGGDSLNARHLCVWFAREMNDLAIYPVATRMGKETGGRFFLYTTPESQNFATRISTPPVKYFRGMELITLRTRWSDPNAMFVGLLAGNNQVNHNHLDCGSFILDAQGERWFIDLGPDNYNLPGYFGKDRYQYYRVRAEGHNTLVINPKKEPDQNLKAICKITQWVPGDQVSRATADLTPAYLPDAQQILRCLEFSHTQYQCRLRDDILLNNPGTIYWFAHTRAQVTISPDGREAMLTQNNKKLTVTLLKPTHTQWTIMEALPLSSSPQPSQQAINTNVRKLSIHLTNIRQTTIEVEIKAY